MEWQYKKKIIDLYDAQSQKEVRQASQIMRWCNLENCSILLDVACGTGDPARGIAAQAPNVEVIGIDIAMTRIRQGKNWASEDSLANVHFVIGDFENLPFKEGVFDTATCVGAFQPFINLSDVLVEISRVLKLEGRLVLSTILVPEDQEGYDFINMLSRLGVWPGGCLGYPSKSELDQMLRGCGFQVKLILKDAKNWKGENRQPALAGKEVANAARIAKPELKQHFKIKVEDEKVFFDYPKPLVTVVGKKTKTVSVKSLNIPKPRYLISHLQAVPKMRGHSLSSGDTHSVSGASKGDQKHELE